MLREKGFGSYKRELNGKFSSYVNRNKKVTPVEKAPGSRALVPAKSLETAPVVRPDVGVSSIIGKEIQDKKETDNVITVDQMDRLEGTYIIGRTGAGKSTLIENLVLQDIDNNLGVFLIDPDGELINNVLRRMNKRLEDVVLIDLNSDKHVAPLNLFYCKDTANFKERQSTISSFMHVLRSFYSVNPKTPDMNHYFTNIAKTLMYNPQNTLLDIQRLFDDDAFRKRLVANVPDEKVREFWEVYYEKHQRGMERDRAISFVVNKLLEFTNDVMMPWFASAGKGLSFRELADEQKLVFIKLKPEWVNSSELMGNIIIAYLLDAAYSRSDITDIDDRQQVNIYVDEFQDVASFDFAKLFTRGRKYKFGITVANQVRAMIDDMIKATCDQAANIFVFPVSPGDAKELANVFDCSARPGEPRYEDVMTPVSDPIQYMLGPNRGVNPQEATRKFIRTYGKKLVEAAKLEEDLEKERRHEEQRFMHDIEANVRYIAPPLIQVTRHNRLALEKLNDLFFAAMLAGIENRNPDDIPIFELGFLLEMLHGMGFSNYQDYETYARNNGIQIVDSQERIKQLESQVVDLLSFRKTELKELYGKKKAAEEEWYREMQLKHGRDMMLFHQFITIFGDELELYEDGKVIQPDEYMVFEKVETVTQHETFVFDEAMKLLKSSAGYKKIFGGEYFEETGNVDLLQFVHFSKRVEQVYQNKGGKNYVNDHDIYKAFRKLQEIPYFLAYWWIKRLQERETAISLEREIDLIARNIREFYLHKERMDNYWTIVFKRALKVFMDNYSFSVGVIERIQDCFSMDSINSALYQRSYELQSILEKIKETKSEIAKEKQAIEAMVNVELAILTNSKRQKEMYHKSLSDLEEEIRMVMRELAVCRVEAPSGQKKEVPTEILSDQVERIVVEEIKGLKKRTARVKVPSGEYVIATIPPSKGLDKEALRERIIAIQERNVADKYLRLRSDVEREILERQQPPEPVQQETAVVEKSRGQNKPAAVAAGAVAPPVTGRRKVKRGS